MDTSCWASSSLISLIKFDVGSRSSFSSSVSEPEILESSPEKKREASTGNQKHLKVFKRHKLPNSFCSFWKKIFYGLLSKLFLLHFFLSIYKIPFFISETQDAPLLYFWCFIFKNG